jgi:integrase
LRWLPEQADGIVDGIGPCVLQDTVMLSDTQVKHAKPKRTRHDAGFEASPRKLADAQGLYLYVSATGARSWRYDYRFNGRRRTVTYGLYPALSLAMARDRHHDARRLLASGIDPAAKKRQDRRDAVREAANTVAALAEDWYTELAPHKSESWRENVRRWLDKRVYPAIGTLPAADVTSADVLVLVKDMAVKHAKSAEYVRQMLSRIFTYGVRNLRCSNDPAHAVRGAITVPAPIHHRPLTDAEIPAFIAGVRAYQGRRSTVIAAELLLLTCVRKSELLGAQVSEIDFEGALWRIPGGERMKNGLDHIVPLSAQALALFREAVTLNFGSACVFPHLGRHDKPMAASTLNNMFERCGFEVSPHAMRATFSTAANESGMFRVDVIEKALAHVERNRVRASYNAAEYLPERRQLLQWWADHVTGLDKPKANVTAISGRRKRA